MSDVFLTISNGVNEKKKKDFSSRMKFPEKVILNDKNIFCDIQIVQITIQTLQKKFPLCDANYQCRFTVLRENYPPLKVNVFLNNKAVLTTLF